MSLTVIATLSWVLIFQRQYQQEETKTVTDTKICTISTDTIKTTVNKRSEEEIEKHSATVGIKGVIEGIEPSFTMSDTYGTTTSHYLENSLYERIKTSFTETKTITTTIHGKAGQNVTQYQLQLNGPGIAVKYDIMATAPEFSPRRVTLNFPVTYATLLKRVRIWSTSVEGDTPPVHWIQEKDGRSSDLNKKFGGKYSYVYAETTINPQEAAFNLVLHRSRSKPPPPGYVDFAKGAEGDYRWIVADRDVSLGFSALIDFKSLKLWRSSHPQRPTEGGFQACSEDLNVGRTKDYLYLCWTRFGHDAAVI